MAEYIEREAAKDELLSWTVCINHTEHLMREDAIHVLDAIPAADVAPVRHGRWIESEDEYGMILTCSVCGEDFVSWEADCARTNYCPNYGSDMRGSDDER